MSTHDASPGDEYVKDVPYERSFTPEMSPAAIRLVAAMSGVAPPAPTDFDYLELGCGNGDTLNVLAAAHPRARFVGVDFNPEHVALARETAKAGELRNVRFLERDFEDLASEALPAFDVVAMHGVLSWISPSKRRAVLAAAASRLRPGGLLYASYNALPGWAAIEPMRRFMREQTADVPGTTLDRARAALRLLEALRAAGAPFFASHPTATTMLEAMRGAGLRYVVHEYFHQHWHPLWFGELEPELVANGLGFVGQIPAYLNVRALAVPPAIEEAARGVTERAAWERLKDFALNEFFRMDVYVKEPAARSEATAVSYFRETPFGTLVHADAVSREARLPHATLRFDGPLNDALVPAIAAQAASAQTLARRPELAGFGVDAIAHALSLLAVGGRAAPMTPSRASVRPSPRLRVPSAFNRRALAIEHRGANPAPTVVASTTLGSGVPLSVTDVVCLRALTESDPATREAWIHAFLQRLPLRLVAGGEAVRDEASVRSAIVRALEGYDAPRIAKLVELGVLAYE